MFGFQLNIPSSNRKNMKHFHQIIALALFVTCGTAHAAGVVSTATVTGVDVRSDDTFLVTFSKNSRGAPACNTVLNRMSGKVNTAGGKAVLATAMLAYSSGSQVAAAFGSGACGAEYGGIESLTVLQLAK